MEEATKILDQRIQSLHNSISNGILEIESLKEEIKKLEEENSDSKIRIELLKKARARLME